MFIHIASNQIQLCHVVRVQKTCVVISSRNCLGFNENSDSKLHELYEYQEEAATTELDRWRREKW